MFSAHAHCTVGRKKEKNMASDIKQYSDYYLSLDFVAKERYREKLTVNDVEISDPYLSNNMWEDNIAKWPSVEYGNIYNYLVNTPGVYTRQAMQAYKSLDGYNFFISGHVQTCYYNEVAKDSHVCVIKAKVVPSQKVREKSHEPWIIIQKSGAYVVAAHCTCKAGLGEACSHIAAVLFKVMKAVELGLNEECKTSAACRWNRFYRSKIQAQPVTDISFSKSKHGQGKKRQRRVQAMDNVDEVDEVSALRELKRICPTACVLTKNDSDTDSASDDEDLPPLLNRFHEVENKDLNQEELQEKCSRFVRDFTTTEIQATNLEKMTRAQSESPVWHRQRQGRITATVVHDIIVMKQNTPKDSVEANNEVWKH